MGRADNQLIATLQSQSQRLQHMTTRTRKSDHSDHGHFNRPQTEKRHTHPQPRRQTLIRLFTVINRVISVRVVVKIKHIKVPSCTTNSKNQHFRTTTLKFSLAKSSISISHVCSQRTGSRHTAPAQQDWATKSGNRNSDT